MRLLHSVPVSPVHTVDLWVDGEEGALVLRRFGQSGADEELLRVTFVPTADALRAALRAVLRVKDRQSGQAASDRLEALERRLEAARAAAWEEFPAGGTDWDTGIELPSLADAVLAPAPRLDALPVLVARDPQGAEAQVSFVERRLQAARRGVDLDRVPRHAALAPPGAFKAYLLRSGR